MTLILSERLLNGMNGEQVGIISVLFGLVCFGIIYDQAVGRMKSNGFLEPYISYIVAIGTLVTIGGISIVDLWLDWNAGVIALLCFTASGIPMITGSSVRYVRTIQKDIESLRNDES